MTFLLSLLLSSAANADNVPDPRASGFWAGWQLPTADGLYERWDPTRSWASQHVIQILQSVAERMALELPNADPLLIGDISRRGGGRMPGHLTHDKGIDVDIGLFMSDGEQPLGGFLELTPSQLDVRSTWILVRTLLDTDQVQFILLDQGHIERLRAYALGDLGLDAETVDEMFPPPLRSPKWSERGVVRHAPNHRSHLHVRLLPGGDAPAPEPPPATRRSDIGPFTPPGDLLN